MTNPLRNQIEVKLGDETYKARLTIDSIIQIEDAIGFSIIKLVSLMSDGDVRLSYIVTVLKHALRGGGNDLDDKKIKSLVGDTGIVDSTRIVAEILTKTLVDSDEESEEELKKKE